MVDERVGSAEMETSPEPNSRGHAMFIGGTGRSGTTIVGRLLLNHPDVMVYVEPCFINNGATGRGIQGLYHGRQTVDEYLAEWTDAVLPKLSRNMLRYHEMGEEECRSVFSVEEIRRLAQSVFSSSQPSRSELTEYLHRLYEYGMQYRGKQWWVDKSPVSLHLLPMLLDLFDDLRFVHVFRDPKNIASSLFERDFGPNDVKEFIPWYTNYMGSALEVFRKVDRASYLPIHLETLVRSPRESVRAMFQFFGFMYTDEIIDRACNSLDPSKVLNNRWLRNISVIDALKIDAHCAPIYNLWCQCAERLP